jgi:hypothetical protein
MKNYYLWLLVLLMGISWRNTSTAQCGGFSIAAVVVSNYNGAQISCFGAADGQANVVATGGTAPYTYIWSINGQTTSMATGLMAGNYVVTVTDALNCTNIATVNITEPTQVVPFVSAQTPVWCFGERNGSVCLMASGGVAPYTFLWNVGQNTSCATGLPAGTYFGTVSDVNGCTDIVAAIITEPAAPIQVSINQTNTTCASVFGASACAVATDGTAPYFFLWSNGATGACISGLGAGIYTVTVTDANNCVGVSTTTITQSAAAIQVSINATNATCGNADGSACAVATGGVAPYSFVWSNIQTTSCATGLGVGNYMVSATDANGCMAVEMSAITNTSGISVSLSSQVNILCFGSASGSACVGVSGGVAPYSFVWSDGQTSSCATGLVAGSYTVTVTDANNCIAVLNRILTQPAQPLQVVINQNCQQQAGNYSATAVATGGTMPYSYVWNTGQTTAQVTGLLLGNVVTVSVSDNNSCQAQHTITISNNGSNIIYTPQVLHSNCGINARSGRINLSVTAVNPTFRWSSGQLTQNISALSAGVYTVTISAQGCQEIATFSVGGIGITVQNTPISCNNSGTIQLVGNLPYQYLWSDGSTNATLSSQNSQYHQVTITDPLSGCAVVQNYYLNANCYSIVQGQINYVDANGNCTGVAPYNTAVWLRRLHTNNVYMTTTNQGFYRFNIGQPDSFEVFLDTTQPAIQMICPTPHRQTIHVPLGQTVTVPSFYVAVNGNDLQVLPFSGGFVPGFMRSMCIPVRNNGEAVNSAFVVLQYPPTIQFANTSTPHQHDAINHQITLTLPSMAHNQISYVCINFITPIGTPLGTPVPFTATVYPLSGDLTPSNNTCQNVFTVSGSYDPNDKQVQPFHSNNEFLGGIILPEEEILHYTIRFQNTGTAPAQFVIIRDTLDAYLLPETIHNIQTSHNATVRFAGRELVFEMDNIMLPDSATDLEGSQGFVKFSINRDNTLPLGTNIANTAAIYFDYNLPVITNTTNSVVDILSALERTPMTQHQWKVMPNPFDEHLTIQYTLHQSSATQIYLVNALGQTVQMQPQQAEQTVGEYQTQISTQALPSGIYWIVLETAQGKLVQKIVKQGSR